MMPVLPVESSFYCQCLRIKCTTITHTPLLQARHDDRVAVSYPQVVPLRDGIRVHLAKLSVSIHIYRSKGRRDYELAFVRIGNLLLGTQLLKKIHHETSYNLKAKRFLFKAFSLIIARTLFSCSPTGSNESRYSMHCSNSPISRYSSALKVGMV